jgi:periplasmic protein TonB
MNEGRTRGLAFIGTIALHVLVVWWLASSPEQTARILRAVEMDFVELEQPAEERPPPPAAAPEAEPEPEIAAVPEPERVQRRRVTKVRQDVTPDSRPASDDPPSPQQAEEPSEGPSDQPPGPRIIDFGEQSFAAAGTGAGWSMRASEGGSRYGVYRPGVRGGGGGGGGPSAGLGPLTEERPDFSPVPQSQLTRQATLIGRLERRYPEEARRAQIEGIVRLMVEVRANGRVRQARAISDPGGGLGEAAVEAIRRVRFRPALDREGQPVDTRIVYTVRYILDD